MSSYTCLAIISTIFNIPTKENCLKYFKITPDKIKSLNMHVHVVNDEMKLDLGQYRSGPRQSQCQYFA